MLLADSKDVRRSELAASTLKELLATRQKVEVYKLISRCGIGAHNSSLLEKTTNHGPDVHLFTQREIAVTLSADCEQFVFDSHTV